MDRVLQKTRFGESLILLANHQLATATRSKSDSSDFLPSYSPSVMWMVRAWEDAGRPEIKTHSRRLKVLGTIAVFVTLDLHVTEP